MAINRVTSSFDLIIGGLYKTKSEEFMLEDLARSGLKPSDMQARVDEQPPLPHGSKLSGSYWFPYYTVDGGMSMPPWEGGMYRRRHDFKESVKRAEAKKIGKYGQPSREVVGELSVMPYMPPFPRKGPDFIICEGEKKIVSAIIQFDRPGLAIGGCGVWQTGDNEAPQYTIHEDIVARVRDSGAKRVIVVPDEDVTRDDIGRQYRMFISRLSTALPNLTIVIKALDVKIDDWLVEADPTWEDFLALPEVDLQDLAASAADLCDEFGLMARINAEGEIRGVVENEANVYKILTLHPRWAGQWKYNDESKDPELFGRKFEEHVTEGRVQTDLQEHFHLPTIGQEKVLRVMIRVTKENRYAPTQDWLRECGKNWNKKKIADNLFAGMCGTDSDGLHRDAAYSFLGGMVKRIMDPGCDFRTMVIVGGPQLIGKSKLAEWAAGKRGLVDIHAGQLGGMGEEFARKIAGKRIIRADDVDTFRAADLGRLKSEISGRYDNVRMPYERRYEEAPRICVWYGTTNKTSVLPYDETGNTRFLYVWVVGLWDFRYLDVQRDQIFGEIYCRRNEGEDPAAIDLSVHAKAQEQHIDQGGYADEIEGFIRTLPKMGPPVVVYEGKKYWMMELKNIWAAVGRGAGTLDSWTMRKFGESLRAMGWIYSGKDTGPIHGGVRWKKVWLFPAPP